MKCNFHLKTENLTSFEKYLHTIKYLHTMNIIATRVTENPIMSRPSSFIVLFFFFNFFIFLSLNIAFHMILSCFTQNVLLSYETSLPFAQNTVSSRVCSKCCSQRTQNCPFSPQVEISPPGENRSTA